MACICNSSDAQNVASEDVQKLFEDLDVLKGRQKTARVQLRLMMKVHHLGSGTAAVSVRSGALGQTTLSVTEISICLCCSTLSLFEGAYSPVCNINTFFSSANASLDIGAAKWRLLDMTETPIIDFELSKFCLQQVM